MDLAMVYVNFRLQLYVCTMLKPCVEGEALRSCRDGSPTESATLHKMDAVCVRLV
uniref:Uncharacterized protein n=1 Tax=Anguilla anguilla TaxID=7936 RepID=A0A0E9XI31_ANGAN